ncbi:N-6 DNA methylase [Asaccharospora irregularis]|uniref:site-specific DNA-methyltransferase (adenine-specific) n=1 Tax=Asaccharospora irregularis DSM 2635 TaxID=1121321 RepID=A0A1M5TD73_9FIRM|nr:N-6 DNA methylase [Asaccharospora irregularis]SHH48293.1 N-6 DNA Methylase [Asaccharospora irregularis DSM 2635]
MNKFKVGFDVIRDVEPMSKRLLITTLSGVKVVLVNKNRLKVKIGYDWNYTSLDKNNLISTCMEIGRLTNLEIFKDKSIISLTEEMQDADFYKLIEIINSTVDPYDITGFCKQIRSTSNVDGKMYDTNTPDAVLDIAVKIIDPGVNDSIVDYFNGESGLELALVEHLDLDDENGFKLKYYGQEIDKVNYEIGQLINFLITGNEDRIVRGDSIYEPMFKEGNDLVKFDVSISNPPFMMKVDRGLIQNDTYNRFRHGANLVTNSDWITAEQVISSLKDDGKGAVLLPIGALFRGGAEERVRRSIISEDLIETIVKIPGSVLSYTNIVACWVIFNKNKEENRKGKIQFIDLSSYIESIDRRNKTISRDGVHKAVQYYKNFEENEISFIVDSKKIEEQNYDLNAFDYIQSEELIRNISSNMKMVEFSKIAQIRRGVQVNKGKLDALNTGSNRSHYLISIGNITDGKIIVNESDMIQIERKWEGVYEVKQGDLLVTSKGSQFKVAIVEEDIKAIVSANLFIVRVYDDKYIPEVLKYYLESELGQNLIQGIIKGTAIKSIAHKDIEKLLVPDIDMKMQKKAFNMIVESNSEYEDRIRKANELYKKEQDQIKNLLNL